MFCMNRANDPNVGDYPSVQMTIMLMLIEVGDDIFQTHRRW